MTNYVKIETFLKNKQINLLKNFKQTLTTRLDSLRMHSSFLCIHFKNIFLKKIRKGYFVLKKMWKQILNWFGFGNKTKMYYLLIYLFLIYLTVIQYISIKNLWNLIVLVHSVGLFSNPRKDYRQFLFFSKTYISAILKLKNKKQYNSKFWKNLSIVSRNSGYVNTLKKNNLNTNYWLKKNPLVITSRIKNKKIVKKITQEVISLGYSSKRVFKDRNWKKTLDYIRFRLKGKEISRKRNRYLLGAYTLETILIKNKIKVNHLNLSEKYKILLLKKKQWNIYYKSITESKQISKPLIKKLNSLVKKPQHKRQNAFNLIGLFSAVALWRMAIKYKNIYKILSSTIKTEINKLMADLVISTRGVEVGLLFKNYIDEIVLKNLSDSMLRILYKVFVLLHKMFLVVMGVRGQRQIKKILKPFTNFYEKWKLPKINLKSYRERAFISLREKTLWLEDGDIRLYNQSKNLQIRKMFWAKFENFSYILTKKTHKALSIILIGKINRVLWEFQTVIRTVQIVDRLVFLGLWGVIKKIRKIECKTIKTYIV